jgi:predicted DNA-binding transcriptional regulator YafY
MLALDQQIRSGRYPTAELMAAQLEVHPRTVHRDLEFMRDSWRAPIEYSREKNGYYYADPDYSLPIVRLSEGELIAIFLAERLLQEFQGTPFGADLAAAFEKLTAHLPDEVTIDLSHLRESFSFRHQSADAGDARCFAALLKAVQKAKQLELEYWSASRDMISTRVVDPYHLASIGGEWYLIGYCHLREGVRMFVPRRIKKLRETGERFARPADFKIADYLDGTFRAVRGDGEAVTVRLRFSPDQAKYVRERVWHPSQELKQSTDGGLELTIRVNHLLEVKRWILSYGAGCEVLEPAELREELRAEAKAMLDRD